jgi:hypothetical protein
MRLVVQDDDVLQAHQLRHDPLEHLALSLQRLELLLPPAFQGRAGALGDVDALPQLEGVIVGDDNLRPVDVGQHVGRDDFPAPKRSSPFSSRTASPSSDQRGPTRIPDTPLPRGDAPILWLINR